MDIKVEVKQELDHEQDSNDEDVDKNEVDKTEELLSLKEVVENEMITLQQDNRRLHNMVTNLHQRHHEHTLKVSGDIQLIFSTIKEGLFVRVRFTILIYRELSFLNLST